MKNRNILVSSDYGPLIVNVNDQFITRDIFNVGYWSSDEIKIIQSIMAHQLAARDRITVYDLGANIGTHSLAMAKFQPERVVVRAFEAQRQIYYMLCGNMALNSVSNVYCHHNAVSDTDDEMIEVRLPDYDRPNNFGGFELMAPVHTDNENMIMGDVERVATVSVDSFGEKVDLIKMDIEGMEDRALRGADRTIVTHRPVIFVEMAKTDTQSASDFLKSRAYRGYNRPGNLIAIPAESDMHITGLQRVF